MGKQRGRDLLVLAGAFLALFGVFGSIMADTSTAGGGVYIFCVVLTYGIFGLGAGFVSSSWSGGLWLSLPATLLLTVLFVNDGHQLWYLGYLVMIVVCAFVGAAGGARVHVHRRRHK